MSRAHVLSQLRERPDIQEPSRLLHVSVSHLALLAFGPTPLPLLLLWLVSHQSGVSRHVRLIPEDVPLGQVELMAVLIVN